MIGSKQQQLQYRPFSSNAAALAASTSSAISSSYGNSEATSTAQQSTSTRSKIRLSRLVSSHGKNIQMSRRSAERMIRDGLVTVAGDTVTDPARMISIVDASGIIKVGGRRLVFLSVDNAGSNGRQEGSIDGTGDAAGHARSSNNNNKAASTSNSVVPVNTRVWLAHKLPGEIVAEDDPHGRPSILDRLRRGGVGKPKKKSQRRVHLKPIGRLDMMTEGLLILTNDGNYAREMELPGNLVHRTYRARVHGQLTQSKMRAIRNGVKIDDYQYGGMDVRIEKAPARRERSANTWIRITCSEGKNRQVSRNLFI